MTWRRDTPIENLVAAWSILSAIYAANGWLPQGRMPAGLQNVGLEVLLDVSQMTLDDEDVWDALPCEVELTINELRSVRNLQKNMRTTSNGQSPDVPEFTRPVLRNDLREALKKILDSCRAGLK